MLVLEREESKMEVIIKIKIRLYPVLVGCSSSIPKLAVNNKEKAFGGMITDSAVVETLLQFFLARDLFKRCLGCQYYLSTWVKCVRK